MNSLTYYCFENEIFNHYATLVDKSICIIKINYDELGNYPENEMLLISMDCKNDISAWKGLVAML